jgi:phosphatidylglycerophosphate synthase
MRSAVTARRKPWDARLAAWLVAPLAATPLSPNLLTTLRLGVGLTGAWLFARGVSPNLAAGIVVLSNFLDHTDGEFARMTGRTSRFGHLYDLASDAAVTVALFICMGWGLRATLGEWSVWMGLVSGLAVAGIFQLRYQIEEAHGKRATSQPRLAGFEAEDVLYLLPLVTLTGALPSFLQAASLGAPAALLIVLMRWPGHENSRHRRYGLHRQCRRALAARAWRFRERAGARRSGFSQPCGA